MKKAISVIMAIIMLMSVIPTFAVPAESVSEVEIPFEEEKSIKEVEKEILSLKAEVEEFNSLYSASGTISGRVYLPAGVTAKAGDKARIYIYKANEFDGDVLIKEYDSAEISKNFAFSLGSSSVDWSVNVPAGSYNVAARLYNGNKEVSGEMVFECLSGDSVNSYLADKITITSGGTKTGVDINLKAPTSYIEGTIDLSNNIPSEDTYINLSAQNENNKFYSYSYAYIYAPKGATSVPYEIGVTGDNVNLRVGSDYFSHHYYADGTLKDSYNDRIALDMKEAVSGLDIKIPVFEEKESLSVKISFPKAAQDTMRYLVAIVGEPDEWGYAEEAAEEWVYRKSGETAIYSDLKYDKNDTPLYLSWRDITGSDSIYIKQDESTLYYSREYGVVGDISLATDIRELSEIEVVYPEYYTVSGSIDTHGITMPATKYVYVGAEFEDEIFCERVNAFQKTFEICIPKRLEGKSFKIFVCQDSLATCSTETVIYGNEYALGGNIADVVADSGNYREITGSVSIAAPVGADGVCANVGYTVDGDEFFLGKVVIRPGSKTASFAFPVPAQLPEGTYLYAESTVYAQESIAEYTTEDITKDKFELFLGENVVYSGVIKTPDNEPLSESMTFQIIVQGENDMWLYSYASIEKGKSYTNYSISIPKNTYIERFSVSASKTNDNFVKEIYYTSSGFKGAYTKANITATESVELDIDLVKARVFSGTVEVPDKYVNDGGKVGYYVYAQNLSTNAVYNSEYYYVSDFENGVPFKLAVPSDGGEYAVYVNVSNAGGSNLMQHTSYYYISDRNMTTSQSSAARLSSKSGMVLTLPLAKTVSGKIKFQDNSIIRGYDYEKELEVYITLESTSGGRNCYKSYYIKNTEEIPFSIPVAGNDSYTMKVRIYNNENMFTDVFVDKNMYLTSSGISENEDDAITVQGGGASINFVVPKYKTLSGKVNVSSDYQSITRPKTGWTYLTKSGETSSKSYKTYFDENLNYVTLLDGDVSGSYTASLSFGDMATNIVKKSYSYGEEAISIGNADVSGLNYSGEIGYAVSGVIALPEDAKIEGMTHSGYFYIHSKDGTTYSNYVRNIGEDEEIPFMFGVPKSGYDGAYLKLSINGTSGQGTSNIYVGDTYYVNNTQSTSKDANKTTMNITGDVSGLRLNILTGIVYTFNMSRPEGNTNRMNGNICLVDENGTKLKNNSFYIYENDNGPKTVQFVFPNEDAGKKFSMYYKLNSGTYSNPEGLYKGKVYIAPDGTLSAFKEDIVYDTLSENKTFDIELVKEEDVEFPDYVFESTHPYPAGKSSYTYRHSDTSVNALTLTFSEDTCVAQGDKIKISGNDNYYYGSDLAGKTITVSGNYVTITVEATSYSEGEFGFGVTKIDGLKYVITSTHPYYRDYQEHAYEYTYPEDVLSIDITFAPECEMASGDYLYVFNSADATASSYNYISRNTGKFSGTVTVPGNYVKIIHDINGSGSTSCFGFAVLDIKPTPTYTIKYVDYDDTVLGEYTVVKGDTTYEQPDEPETYYEDGWVYEFVDWDKDIPSKVEENIVIKAVYERERYIEGLESEHPKKTYTTTTYGPYEYEGDAENIFVNFSPKTALYGTRSSSYSSDNIAIYHYNTADNTEELLGYYYGDELSGQTIEIPGKKFKIIYTSKGGYNYFGFRVTSVTPAVYHNVSFYDSDGTFLASKRVPTQTKAVYDGTFPIRATGNTVYEFKDWDKDISCVTEDMEVTAVYEGRQGYFETEHDYLPDSNINYYYVHDNPDAQELKITFSSDTKFDYYRWDYLIIYNQYGVQVGNYTYNDLSGKTITVQGNSFSMNFVSNSSYNGYGFRITNIEAVIPQYYTVTYVDCNDNPIYSERVLQGGYSYYPGAFPEKPMKNGVFYYFREWDTDTSCVWSDLTVRPLYNEEVYTTIYTERDLRNIANNLGGRYVLMNDITLTSPWTPVGSAEPFTGELRGEKHIIRNIKVTSTVESADGVDYAGFFGVTKDAMIREVGFEIDYDLPAHNDVVYVGGVCGFADDTMIERCYVSGSIDVNCLSKCIGGFVGRLQKGMVMSSFVNASITATSGGGIGGFAYELNGGNITRSYANVSIDAPSCSKAGFVYSYNTYYEQDPAGGTFQMNPNVWHGVFNTDKSGISDLTASEGAFGKIWPKSQAEMKTREGYNVYNTDTGSYEDILDFNFEWHLDEDINDGFPHLGFTQPMPEFEEAELSKKQVGGETVTTVSFCFTREIEEDAQVIFAVYKDDVLTGVVPYAVSAGCNGGETDLSYDADYVKIFVWNEMTGLKPLAKSGEAR